MGLIFRCPECEEYVKVSPTLAGLHAHCPSCNVSVPVPDHDMPPDADTASHLYAKKKWEALTAQAQTTAAPATEVFIPPKVAWILGSILVAVLGGILVLAFALQ